MEITIVYDYIGPNGYIPFIYTKKELPNILDKNQKNIIKYNNFSDDTKQVLTKVLWNQKSKIKNNFYLVLVDTQLKDIPLEDILSDTLNLLIKTYPNNIRVIYFDHEAKMQSFI